MVCCTVSRFMLQHPDHGAATVHLHPTVRNHIWEDSNLLGNHHKHAEIPSLNSNLAGFSSEEFSFYILVVNGRHWPLWQKGKGMPPVHVANSSARVYTVLIYQFIGLYLVRSFRAATFLQCLYLLSLIIMSCNFYMCHPNDAFTLRSCSQLKSPTRCNKSTVYYPDVYLQPNMFRAFSRPSSGAQWLQ
jgi:hypothetical protein